jgi:hypothetical protein
MNESKNIDSNQDPFKKTNDSDSVDSEKFKKAFRVEKSEETGEKGKRKRPQELSEEEDEVDVSIPVPQGLFKEYMTDKEKGPSILDTDGGSNVHFVTDGAEEKDTSKMFISDPEDEQRSTISIGVSENTPSLPNLSENEPDENIDDSDDPFPLERTTENSQLDLFTNPPAEQQTQTPSTTSNSEPATPKKEKAIKKAAVKPVTSKTPTQKVEVKKEATFSTHLEKKEEKEEEKKPLPVQITDPELSKDPNGKIKVELKEKKDENEEKVNSFSSPEKVSDKDGSSHDKKDDSDKDNHEDTVIQAAVPISSPAGIVALQMSPFANMPSDVFTLFEKMVGLMTIQKENGKSTTTVTLNMAGSVFDKSELVLEHYDTAPHAYNVQFFGSPESVEKFAKNFSLLNSAINESKLSFSINILPPKLSKNYVNRVNAASDKGDKDEENDSEKKQK